MSPITVLNPKISRVKGCSAPSGTLIYSFRCYSPHFITPIPLPLPSLHHSYPTPFTSSLLPHSLHFITPTPLPSLHHSYTTPFTSSLLPHSPHFITPTPLPSLHHSYPTPLTSSPLSHSPHFITPTPLLSLILHLTLTCITPTLLPSLILH